MDSKRLQMIEMLHKIASVKNESECMVSCGYLFVNPWTVARQAPLSMEFPRQVYWSGLPFPISGDLLDPRMEPLSVASPALAGGFFNTVPPGKF